MAGGDDQSRFEQDWHLLWSYHQIHDQWLSTCAKTLESIISPFVNASKPKTLAEVTSTGGGSTDHNVRGSIPIACAEASGRLYGDCHFEYC